MEKKLQGAAIIKDSLERCRAKYDRNVGTMIDMFIEVREQEIHLLQERDRLRDVLVRIYEFTHSEQDPYSRQIAGICEQALCYTDNLSG